MVLRERNNAPTPRPPSNSQALAGFGTGAAFAVTVTSSSRNSPSAMFLKSYIPGEGAYDVPDVADTNAAFVVSGFTQARGVVWDTEPMAHADGATDVRLFRIFAVDTAVGLSVSN